jgi:hypothetical protein
MKTPTQVHQAIALQQIADAVVAFDDLPLIDPGAFPEGTRAGFLHSLERVHENIHIALQRYGAAAQPNTQPR